MAISKWTIKEMSLSDLKVSDENPRVISNRNFQGLMSSVRRFGLVEPIVWNEMTGRIVSGHQRFRVLVDMGITKTKVLVVNMETDEADAASLTMNNPAVEGEFDEPILDLLKHIGEEDEVLFKELNMGQLLKAIEKDTGNTRSSLGGDDENDEPGVKTSCPCCGYKWEVSIEDVKLE